MIHQVIHQIVHLTTQNMFLIDAHHSTDGLSVLCKLVIVLLFFLLHPPLHLLPLHSLLAGAKRRSSSGHLINETAQSPPIRTHAVLFIVYHLWSYRETETAHYGVKLGIDQVNLPKEV